MTRRRSEFGTARALDTAPEFLVALSPQRITPEEVQARLAWRLRRLIGPSRRMSLPDAAQATGINQRTLKAYLEGRACPNLARYGRLLRVFGPEVGIELAVMIGWEPRAANPNLPHDEDLRALRDAIAQVISAIDLMLAPATRPPPAARR